MHTTKKNTDQKILKAVRMDKSLVDRIEEMGERENRSFSNMVITMLLNVVENDFNRHRQQST